MAGPPRTGRGLVVSRGVIVPRVGRPAEGLERLQANGVRFVQPAPEDYPFGVRIEALDPDGNRLSLRQRRR